MGLHKEFTMRQQTMIWRGGSPKRLPWLPRQEVKRQLAFHKGDLSNVLHYETKIHRVCPNHKLIPLRRGQPIVVPAPRVRQFAVPVVVVQARVAQPVQYPAGMRPVFEQRPVANPWAHQQDAMMTTDGRAVR